MSIFTLCFRSLFIVTFCLLSQSVFADISVNTTPTSLNGCDGNITVEVTGTAEPFNVIVLGQVFYVKNGLNSGDSHTFTDLCAGAYTIIVINRFGCEKQFNTTVEKIPCPVITLENIEDAITHPTTCGGSDGDIYFRIGGPTGGTEPYYWSWSNGSTNSRLSFIPSGTYTLTITDAVGCTGVFDFNLTGQDEPEIISVEIAPACVGANNGFVRIAALGEGVDFVWSTGQTDMNDPVSEITNLVPGDYTVTITNAAGNCEIIRTYTVPEATTNLPLSVYGFTSKTCPEVPTGSIQLNITGGVPNPDFVNYTPYDIVWSHGSNQLTNLPAGNYCVTVTDYCGAVVSRCFDIIVDPSKVFDLTLTNFSNATTGESNNGTITVQATPGNPGDFSYQWSNDNAGPTAANLPTGMHYVTVTNSLTGCSIIRPYEVNNCEEVEDFDLVVFGGSALDPNQDIQFEVMIQKGDGNFSNQIPDGYTVKWTTPTGVILSRNTTFTLPENYSYDEVRVEVANGCNLKIEFKTILRCNTQGQYFLGNAFITGKKEPCIGFSDGSAILTIPNSSNSMLEASMDGKPLILYSQGQNYIVEIGNLAGNIEHDIIIRIGECEYSFKLKLDEKETTKEFHHANINEGLCYYSESCNGESFGEEKLYKENAIPDWINSSGGFLKDCKAPMYCNGMYIGDKEYPKATVGAKEYMYILLNAAQGNPVLSAYYESLLNTLGDEHACRKVRYCTGSLTMISSTTLAPFNPSPQGSDYPNEIRYGDDGCALVRCKKSPLTAFLGNTNYVACNNAIDEARQGNKLPINCNARSGNVYELYQLYNAVKSYRPGIIYTPLGNFLENNGFKPEAKCATVSYCSEDLTILGDNMAYVLCNVPIYDCNGVYIGESCTESPITDSHGNILGYRTLCPSTKGLCTPVVNVLGPCTDGDLSYKFDIQNTLNIINSEIQAIIQDVGELADDVVEEIKNIKFFNFTINLNLGLRKINPAQQCPPNVIESSSEELLIKVVVDTFNNEILHRFGIAKASGVPYPRGIINNNDSIVYYGYDHDFEQVKKEDISQIEFFVEDWDYEHLIYIEQILNGKESQLIFEDTTIAWINHISADTLFEVKHLSSIGYDIVLGGTFSGTLQYDSVTVATSDSLSAFLFRIDKDGVLQNLHIIENIALGSQVAFSENRNGAIVIAGKHAGNVSINGTPLAANEGFFVARIDSTDQVQLLGDLQGSSNLNLLDVSYAPDSSNAHVALALRGTGALTLNGQSVVNSITDELTIIALDSINHFNWSTVVPSDSINADKFDMTYGAENSLFVGMTLNLQAPAFAGGGGQDISLLKFDSAGTVVWNKLYGTNEDETVSQLLYDHDILYFGGEFTGSVGDKTIGKYVFSNLIPANTKAYISYVIDGEPEGQGATQRVAENNQIVEPAKTDRNEFENQIEVYPNPFNNKLYIKVAGQQVGRVEIANYLGQTIYSFETGNLNDLEVDFNKNGNGFYFVKVYSENGALMGIKKVVKQ